MTNLKSSDSLCFFLYLQGKLKEWSLVLYGTSIQPYSPRNDVPKVERVRSSPVEEPSEEYNIDDYTGKHSLGLAHH